MVFASGSDPFPTALKILIAGGFGVGKTTLSERSARSSR